MSASFLVGHTKNGTSFPFAAYTVTKPGNFTNTNSGETSGAISAVNEDAENHVFSQTAFV